MRYLRWLAVVGCTVLVTGCGSPSPETPAPAAASSTETSSRSEPSAPSTPLTPSASSASPAVRSTAQSQTATPAGQPSLPATLRFTGTAVDGSSFDGASLRGRPALLWFWAPWCPTCRSQLPEVQRLASTYEDRLQVVGVGSLDSAEAIARFAGQTAGFTVQLVDEKGAVWRHFDITEQSSFVLLDGEGDVRHRTGYGGGDDLEREIEGVVR